MRELPAEEWSALKGTSVQAVLDQLDPANARILVVEIDGVIVAHWALLQVRHVEGLWIDPAHRHVTRALWTAMQALAEHRPVMTAAIDPMVERMLKRAHATQLPGTHWVLPMKETRCQQP